MQAFLSEIGQVGYWAWALAAAGSLYWLMRFAGGHFNDDAKAALSLWLQGDYRETWSAQFCRLFDAFFTERHLSFKCFWRSSLFSIAAVIGLYFLLDRVLGVLDFRAGGRIELWQALAIGVAVNIIPDYLSLYETRWLLGRFARVRSVPGQLGILALDAVFTGAIIWGGITAFQFARGDAPVPLPEMLFLFSIYAIFFYSTFATSVWAWLYCLSSWLMRGVSGMGLHRVLAVEERPVQQLALVTSVAAFVVLLAIGPALRMDADRRTAFDDRLCRLFPVVCDNVAPLTEDEQLKLEYLSRACRGGVDETCVDTGLGYLGINDSEAAMLWLRACDGGELQGCTNLGMMFDYGRGVAQSDAEAVRLYRQVCDGDEPMGCFNLGVMYKTGRGVDQSDAEAVRLYRESCDAGMLEGCSNLGVMYEDGRGIDQSDTEAVALYRLACDGGVPEGCANLGIMYDYGRGVDRSESEAFRLFQESCDYGHAGGCYGLAWMYELGRGVGQNFVEAARLYRQACDGDDARGCNSLAWMHEGGRGVAQSNTEAAQYYDRACGLGLVSGCTALEWMESSPAIED
ncbi:MAG: sel1 repeat family protein [Pseudomonadota bacterium]